jgi:hypothetical protein
MLMPLIKGEYQIFRVLGNILWRINVSLNIIWCIFNLKAIQTYNSLLKEFFKEDIAK